MTVYFTAYTSVTHVCFIVLLTSEICKQIEICFEHFPTNLRKVYAFGLSISLYVCLSVLVLNLVNISQTSLNVCMLFIPDIGKVFLEMASIELMVCLKVNFFSIHYGLW